MILKPLLANSLTFHITGQGHKESRGTGMQPRGTSTNTFPVVLWLFISVEDHPETGADLEDSHDPQNRLLAQAPFSQADEVETLLKLTTTSFKLYGLPSLSMSGNLSGNTFRQFQSMPAARDVGVKMRILPWSQVQVFCQFADHAARGAPSAGAIQSLLDLRFGTNQSQSSTAGPSSHINISINIKI